MAKLEAVDSEEVTCLFMRRVPNRPSFHFPQIEDRMTIEKAKIVFIVKHYVYRRGYLNLNVNENSKELTLLLN